MLVGLAASMLALAFYAQHQEFTPFNPLLRTLARSNTQRRTYNRLPLSEQTAEWLSPPDRIGMLTWAYPPSFPYGNVAPNQGKTHQEASGNN